MIGLLILGLVLISKAATVPEPLRRWVAYAGCLAWIAAVIVAKLMPPE